MAFTYAAFRFYHPVIVNLTYEKVIAYNHSGHAIFSCHDAAKCHSGILSFSVVTFFFFYFL
jgi:hypothetical protein